MKRLMLAALTLLIFSCGPLHASITLRVDDDRIESITDFSIDGVVYDATFHHNISPNDLLALYPNGELPFADNSTATLAAEAIRAAVAAAAITPNNGGLNTAYYYVGFGDFSGGTYKAVLDREIGFPDFYEFNNLQNPSASGLPNAMPANQALVHFAFVPEPSSIAMCCIGALGLFGYSRRRRQTSVPV